MRPRFPNAVYQQLLRYDGGGLWSYGQTMITKHAILSNSALYNGGGLESDVV